MPSHVTSGVESTPSPIPMVEQLCRCYEPDFRILILACCDRVEFFISLALLPSVTACSSSPQ